MFFLSLSDMEKENVVGPLEITNFGVYNPGHMSKTVGKWTFKLLLVSYCS